MSFDIYVAEIVHTTMLAGSQVTIATTATMEAVAVNDEDGRSKGCDDRPLWKCSIFILFLL